MNQIDAVRALAEHDRKHPPVFTKYDLSHLFPHARQQTFDAALNRLVRSRILIRGARGVYVNALSANLDGHTIEHIARALRRGRHNYVSLESALSRHDAISEIPLRLNVMTTGRSGTFRTPFGTIEFTHTRRTAGSIIDGTVDVGRPLRLATRMTAYRDLVRVGRNLDLVDSEALHETQ